MRSSFGTLGACVTLLATGACTTTSVVTVRHDGDPYEIRTLRGSLREPQLVERGEKVDRYHWRHQDKRRTSHLFLGLMGGTAVCGIIVATSVAAAIGGNAFNDPVVELGVASAFVGMGLGTAAIASGIALAAQDRARVGFLPRKTSFRLGKDDLLVRPITRQEWMGWRPQPVDDRLQTDDDQPRLGDE